MQNNYIPNLTYICGVQCKDNTINQNASEAPNQRRILATPLAILWINNIGMCVFSADVHCSTLPHWNNLGEGWSYRSFRFYRWRGFVTIAKSAGIRRIHFHFLSYAVSVYETSACFAISLLFQTPAVNAIQRGRSPEVIHFLFDAWKSQPLAVIQCWLPADWIIPHTSTRRRTNLLDRRVAEANAAERTTRENREVIGLIQQMA